MKLYKVGEKSKALCEQCEKIRSTTFRERTIPLSSGKGSVEDVLVAVCDGCDNIVGIPQQSAPRIQEAIRTSRQPVEARVPRHLMDALNLICHDLGASGQDQSAALFRFFLQRASRSKASPTRLRRIMNTEEATGTSSARFSIKLNEHLFEILVRLEEQTHLKRTDVVKAIMVTMKQDVLDKKDKNLRKDLKEMLLMAG